jgi:phage shock protein A
MAPSTVPFEPSYAALKNLHQKLHKYTTATSVNLSLPIRPQDLSTDSTPYLDGAIGILSNSTTCLYDDDAPWAVRVMEVKSKVLTAVDRVDTKVDKVKTDIAELKMDVTELKTDIAEFKTDVAELKTDVVELKTDIAELKIEMKLLKNHLKS